MPCWESVQFCCVVIRVVFCSIARCLCCKKSTNPKKEYEMICIGLTGAGKSTVLSVLCNEPTESIVPTTGFSIKPCQFSECVLNIKEIGGGEKQRPFWKHYYHNAQAVLFVVDSACNEDELATAKEALHIALSHPDLDGLPCLILCNCQDKPGARNEIQLSESLELDKLSQNIHRQLSLCSAIAEPAGIRRIFESFIESYILLNQLSEMRV